MVGVATLTFLASILASYVAAATRPIPPIEIRAADRGLISALAYTGMVLAMIEGLRHRRSLDVVLMRLVTFGGIIAGLGLVQFATGRQLTDFIEIPGLSANFELGGLESRGGLNRPSGTAIHPIEYGAVLTMLLPLALHYAMYAKERSTLARWWSVALIAGSIGICISRSAVVSAVLGLAILVPSWSPSLRRRAYVAIIGVLVTFYLFVPGLLGTLTAMFTGIAQDNSAQSRTDSYGIALDFIPRALWFGRGSRTFLPSYRILDNQFILSLIETGVVGVAAFLFAAGAGVFGAHRVRRRSTDRSTRDLAQALIASIAAATLSTALYDSFSFPMAATLFFVLLGASGALVASQRGERTPTAAHLRSVSPFETDPSATLAQDEGS
jgi:O-antigen ligase